MFKQGVSVIWKLTGNEHVFLSHENTADAPQLSHLGNSLINKNRHTAHL